MCLELLIFVYMCVVFPLSNWPLKTGGFRMSELDYQKGKPPSIFSQGGAWTRLLAASPGERFQMPSSVMKPGKSLKSMQVYS